MFKFNKGAKNYINAVDKIKIPVLPEENKKNIIEFVPKNKLSFAKPAFLAIAVLITFFITSINFPSNNKDIPFSIKAYTGNDSLELKNKKTCELPSGNIENDTFVMQGLLLEGNIYKINASWDNGSIIYISGNNPKYLKTTEYIGEHCGYIKPSIDSPYMHTIKFMNDEEIKKIHLSSTPKNDITSYNTEKNNLNQNYDIIKDYSCFTSTISDTDHDEFIINNKYKYNYILWSPGKKFLKQLCTTGIESISELPKANIDLTITFTDGHTEEKNIYLAFNRSGNLEINLNY